ncbi:MAG: hypothetical protein Phog2KO_20290 [Phototrophicaceae bacterium]
MKIEIDIRWFAIIAVLIFSGIMLNAQNDNDLISGYEIVSAETDSSEDDFQFVEVFCPKGKVAIGGGAGIFYSSEEGYDVLPTLVSSFMYPDNTGWYAEAIQPEEANTEWYLEVQVICAYVED